MDALPKTQENTIFLFTLIDVIEFVHGLNINLKGKKKKTSHQLIAYGNEPANILKSY